MFFQTATALFVTTFTIAALAAPATLSRRDGTEIRLCTETNLSGNCVTTFADFDACRKHTPFSSLHHLNIPFSFQNPSGNESRVKRSS
jgi:hypothetical protein